jgi:hypothetical protein
MQETLYEHIAEGFGDTSEDCLTKLTPGARGFVCGMIERIWERYSE